MKNSKVSNTATTVSTPKVKAPRKPRATKVTSVIVDTTPVVETVPPVPTPEVTPQSTKDKASILVRARRGIKNGAVNASSAVLGATHFVGYTVAEIALATECAIKLKADGIDPSETKEQRIMATLAKQQVAIDAAVKTVETYQQLRNRLRNKKQQLEVFVEAVESIQPKDNAVIEDEVVVEYSSNDLSAAQLSK